MLRSGINIINGLNEEYGTHKRREDKKEGLCGVECESVSHMLWDCPEYILAFTEGAWR